MQTSKPGFHLLLRSVNISSDELAVLKHAYRILLDFDISQAGSQNLLYNMLIFSGATLFMSLFVTSVVA